MALARVPVQSVRRPKNSLPFPGVFRLRVGPGNPASRGKKDHAFFILYKVFYYIISTISGIFCCEWKKVQLHFVALHLGRHEI